MNIISTLVPIKIFPHFIFVGICHLTHVGCSGVSPHLTPSQGLDIKLGMLNEESEV